MPIRDEILEGDCLRRLPEIPEGAVDLAYLDPPFATGRKQSGRDGHAYEDAWESIQAWIDFMRPRLEQTIRTLSGTGAILVHCDWRTSHHVRVL